MKELWAQIQENTVFLLTCSAIIAGLFLVAKLSEQYLLKMRKTSVAQRVSIIGICGAIATVLHIMDFPLLFLAPEFYKLDFSELPVMLCGFYLGPSAAVGCQALKIILCGCYSTISLISIRSFIEMPLDSNTFLSPNRCSENSLLSLHSVAAFL